MRVLATTNDTKETIEIDLEDIGGFDAFIYASKRELVSIILDGCKMSMYKEDLIDFKVET